MSNHEESLLGNINFIDGTVLQLMWDHDKKTHSGLHDNYYISRHKTVHISEPAFYQIMKLKDVKLTQEQKFNSKFCIGTH